MKIVLLAIKPKNYKLKVISGIRLWILTICNVKPCCRADWMDQSVLSDWHFELYGGVYAHTQELCWFEQNVIKLCRAYNNFVVLDFNEKMGV